MPDGGEPVAGGAIPFDVAGARAAGYSDGEIANYVGGLANFNVEGARKAGYYNDEIIDHLAAQPTAPEPPPAPQSQAKADINAAAQGPILGAGAAIAGTGELFTAAGAQGTRRQLAAMDAIDQGQDVPQDQDPIGYQFLSADQRAKARADFSAADTELSKREPNALTRAGDAVEQWGRDTFPVAPENEGLQTGAARAVTGMVPLVLASIFGGPVGTTAAMASMFPQGYHSTLKEAKEAGASQEDAEAAATASATLTTMTMMVPLSRVMQLVPVPLRAGLAKTLVDLGQKGVEFASFNALSTIANNYVAQQSFEPDRPLLQGVPQAAAEGFIAGPVLHGMGLGVTAAASRLPGRPNVQPRPAVQDVLNADNLDTAIDAAQQVASTPGTGDISSTRSVPPSAGTPIDVRAETEALSTGGSADLQQAALLKLFHNTGAGTVEATPDGGYQFRTTDASGAEITHPIEVWHPDSEPDASAIPLDTVHALQDHYGQAGVDVVFYKDHPGISFDGAADPSQPDTIFLSSNPARNIEQVAGHEFTHVLQTTTLPDGSSLGELLHQQIAAGLTPAGMNYAKATFGSTAPLRSAFPEGPDGDTAHASAVTAHLINEMGADIGGEAPKFQSFLPRVVDAIQQRFGDGVAGDVLRKLLDGLKSAMDTIRGLFGETGTRSQIWVTNISEIHDTLAQMYAQRFGTPVEREQAALGAMRDKAERDRFVAEPAAPAPEAPAAPVHPSDIVGIGDTITNEHGETSTVIHVLRGNQGQPLGYEVRDPDGREIFIDQDGMKAETTAQPYYDAKTGERKMGAAPVIKPADQTATNVDEPPAQSGSVDNRESQQPDRTRQNPAEPGRTPEARSAQTPEWPQTREGLAAKALQLRRWLDELAAERNAQAAATPQARLLTQTEAAILRPAGGDETKLPAAAQTRLDDVRQQIDAAKHPQADTPEMAKVRDELGATAEALSATAAPAAPPVRPADYGANNKMFTAEMAEKARATLRAKFSRLNAGFDPEMMAAGFNLAGYHIEAGARRFTDYARAMLADLGEGIRPYLAHFYHSVRDFPGFDATGMDNREAVEQALTHGPAESDTLAEQGRVTGDGIQKPLRPRDEGAGAADVHGTPPGERDGSAPPGEVGGGPRDAEATPGERTEVGERPAEEPGGRAGSGGDRPRDTDRVPAGGETVEAGATGRPDRAPDAQVTGTDFRIDPGAVEEGRSFPTKARDNLAAVELTQRLIAEDRPATKAEQAVLAKYVGWGGLPGVFPHPKTGLFGKGLEAVGGRLRDLLSPEEYRTAIRSTQYAHYTAEHVIRSMWDAVTGMGFKGGTVFEPGMGVGHFLGMMPAELAARSKYEGIEMDALTAKIAKLLYPESGVREADFTRTPLPENSFDLVIGNPPFSDAVIKSDPKYAARGFMLHDYFFAKSLDAVRPGGLLAFVTSAGTMNKMDAGARHYMAERAEFMGGVRLPSSAFRRNAGTDVTTDVLFFRKRPEIAPLNGAVIGDHGAWTSVVNRQLPDAKGGITEGYVNRYFSDHPEQVLGQEGFFDKLYQGRYAVHQTPGTDLPSDLKAAVDRLPKDVMTEPETPADRARLDFASGQKKDGSFYVNPDGRLMQYSNGAGTEVARRGAGVEGGFTPVDLDRIRRLVPIRDALRDVFSADLAHDDVASAKARAELNAHYDRFVGAFGPVNKVELQYRRPTATQQESARLAEREDARDRGEYFNDGEFDPSPFLARNATMSEIALARQRARVSAETAGRAFDEGDFDPAAMANLIIERRPNIKPFMSDPESYRLRSIEAYDDATGVATKRRIFTENILTHEQEPRIASANDGVLWSLNKFGRFDLGEIAAKMGRNPDAIVAELGDAVFKVPGQGNTWQTSGEYLSGDVVSKLETARAQAEHDPDVRRNIAALEAAVPPPLAPSEITMTIGMPWLDRSYVQQFIQDRLHIGDVRTEHNPIMGQWLIDPSRSNRGDRSGMAEWGTADMPPHEILSAAMNRVPPKIYHWEGYGSDRRSVFDPVATQAAQDKVAALKQAFQDWISSDPAREDAIAALYNNKLNRVVERQFDGAYLTTPGIASDWHWRPHQQAVVSRIIQVGNTYMAHAVGSGKTSAMIGAGMEMRRLGLVKKPMYVVPNHMLAQFAKEFYEQYPTARIMVADEQRFHTDRRRQFISDVAQSDIDGVIITHSGFGKIPISEEFGGHLIREQIADLVEALSGLDKQNDRITIKRLEKQKEKLEQRLSKATDKQDLTNTFEELGTDFLFVDEAHIFRKLGFASKQQVKGITSDGSDMAWDLYTKLRYLDGQKPGRAAVFASGTPVTNTMGELYSISRYLQPGELRSRGISHFDSWAQTFGDTKTDLEQTPAGSYAPVTRFSRFVNMPELYKMVASVMDIVTPSELEKYVTRPQLQGGQRQFHLAPRTPALDAYQADLAARVEAIKTRRGPPQKGDDILLSVINDGRHSAIDPRFVEQADSDPRSKLNQMLENVARIHHESTDTQFYDPADGYNTPLMRGPATQMIFANLGVNSRGPMNFSGYKWIRSSLIRAGIPANEIAIIGDYTNHVARQALFNDMNEGKVRILIGSTQKMGTGINAQRRLIALHNQDPLWFPADDEQRLGRMIRQGNLNPEVQVHDYSTKGTYDAVMWGMMGRKGRFIEQFFRGDPNLRDMEDLGEAGMYEQASAMATVDERVLRLTEMQQDLDRAQRREAAHGREQYNLRNSVADEERRIVSHTQTLGNLANDIAQRVDTRGDAFRMRVGDETFTTRKEAGAAFNALADTTFDSLAPGYGRQIAEIGGFPLRVVRRAPWRKNEPDIREYYLDMTGEKRSRELSNRSGGEGTIQSAETSLRSLENDVAYSEGSIAEAHQKLASYRPLLGKQFEGGPEIERLRAAVDDLKARIKAGPAGVSEAVRGFQPTPGLDWAGAEPGGRPRVQFSPRREDERSATETMDGGKHADVTVNPPPAALARMLWKHRQLRLLTAPGNPDVAVAAAYSGTHDTIARTLQDNAHPLGDAVRAGGANKWVMMGPGAAPFAHAFPHRLGDMMVRVEDARGGLVPDSQLPLGIKGRPLFSPRPEDREEGRTPLFSALTRAVEGVKQEKATPGQWIATLKNMAGVKPEERAWTGLDDWLGKQPKSVTKAEVLDYLRANRLDVREVVRGKPVPLTAAETAEVAALRQRFIAGDMTLNHNDAGRLADLENARNLPALTGREPKFGQYTLPGGENYREMLMTLPPKEAAFEVVQHPTRADAFALRRPDGSYVTQPANAVHPGTARLWDSRDMAERYGVRAHEAEEGVPTFRSAHWDEPNVVAHSRFSERTAPDGAKVLHIEEVQSDWHQAGRKHGYDAGPPPDRFHIVDQAGNQRGDFRTREEAQAYLDNPANPIDAANSRIATHPGEPSGVPDAPFKTTWPMLAMKRLTQFAVDHGFDRVAWTPGDVQADRYSLAKQVSSIIAIRRGDKYDLTVTEKGSRRQHEMNGLTTQQLADNVGKEMADRISQQPDEMHRYAGDGLKVGGSGMKAFYDRQLPSEVQKLVGKFGAKVGQSEIDTFAHPDDPNQPTPSRAPRRNLQPVTGFDITPAMREAVQTQGLPLFSPRSRVAVRDERETERWTHDQALAYAHVGRVVEAPTWRERLASVTNDLGRRTVRYWVDPYIGVKADDPAGYMALRNANTTAGATEMFLTDGTLKFNGSTYAMADRNGGVEHSLIRPLHGEQDRFIWWVAANRAERLSAEDRENLWSQDDIDTIKQTNQGQVPFDYQLPNGQITRSREAIYLDSLRKLDGFNKNTLDLAVQSGLLDGDRVSALFANPFYVPFYRVADAEGGFAGPNVTSGFVKQNAFKTLKGGTQKLNNDLWDNAIKNWSHMIDASLRNRAAAGVLDTALTNGAVTELSARDLATQTKAERKNTVWVMNNGRQQSFRIDDPLLFTAVSALNFAGFRNPVMDVMTKFKTVFTQGTTADPRFMLRVSIRDAEQAIATAPMSYNIVNNVMTGFAMGDLPGAMQNVARAVAGQELHRLNLSPEAADVIAGGGTMRLGSGHDTGGRTTDLDTMLDRPATINAFWHRISQIARAYKEVTAQAEDTQRFALYHKLIAEGVPHDQAAYAARDIEDFTLKGAGMIARFLTQTVPFMNAWMQGLYKVGRAATNQDRNITVAVGGRLAASATKRVAIVLGTTALLTLALDAIYADDEDYKKRTDYDRDANFWFKFGDTQFRIPMGFEIAAMSRIAANGVEAFFGRNEMTGRRFANSVLQILGTNMSMSPVPQIVRPIYDLATNTSGTGAPIIGKGMDRLRSEDQYTAASTLAARAVSTAGNAAARFIAGPQAQFLAPIQLDYLVNGYFGWLGSHVVNLADIAARGADQGQAALRGVQPMEPVRPNYDMWNAATGGMISTAPTAQSRYVDTLYQQAEGINRAYATYHDLIARGRVDDARAFFEANKDQISKYGLVNKVEELEATANRQIKRIGESSNISAEQKRLEIMKYNAMRNRAAENVFGARP
jgi:N12 class adenine-specific DNA methylase